MIPNTDIGQHFLIDLGIIDVMLDAARLTTDDTVIEIGAGHGTLTHALAKTAGHVIAIELDDRCIPVLENFFRDVPNVAIVHGDALRWWSGKRKEQKEKFNVVANLPYGITSRVLRMFLEHEPRPEQMVVMVQKEVAERVTAPPGKMSLVSLAVQYYADAHIVTIVPPDAFDPPPAVTSAVLAIRTRTDAINPEEEKRVFQLARMGFASRRKQLHSLLATPFHRTNTKMKAILEAIGVPPMARAQELSIPEWKALARHLWAT